MKPSRGPGVIRSMSAIPLLLATYVMSIGPAHRWCAGKDEWQEPFDVVYVPVNWVADRSPVLHDSLHAWCRWWADRM